jgi:hypothetical protein
MYRQITDDDIKKFLKSNSKHHPTQISLLQAAVRQLWPDGPPTDGGERVVRLCLEENLASGYSTD